MTMDIEKEISELKRKVDQHEMRISQAEGSFQFITGQLRDIQTFMHKKFEGIDAKLGEHDKRFDGIDKNLGEIRTKIDAIPRAVAEMIADK